MASKTHVIIGVRQLNKKKGWGGGVWGVEGVKKKKKKKKRKVKEEEQQEQKSLFFCIIKIMLCWRMYCERLHQ